MLVVNISFQKDEKYEKCQALLNYGSWIVQKFAKLVMSPLL